MDRIRLTQGFPCLLPLRRRHQNCCSAHTDGLPDGTGYKRHRERRNGFFQSVLQDEVGKRAFSAVIPMTQQDAMETTQEPHWQTNRTSDCIPAGLMFTDVRRRQENWWHWAPMK